MADEVYTPLPWYKEVIAIRQTLIIVLTPIILLPIPIFTWMSRVSLTTEINVINILASIDPLMLFSPPYGRPCASVYSDHVVVGGGGSDEQ